MISIDESSKDSSGVPQRQDIFKKCPGQRFFRVELPQRMLQRSLQRFTSDSFETLERVPQRFLWGDFKGLLRGSTEDAWAESSEIHQTCLGDSLRYDPGIPKIFLIRFLDP